MRNRARACLAGAGPEYIAMILLPLLLLLIARSYASDGAEPTGLCSVRIGGDEYDFWDLRRNSSDYVLKRGSPCSAVECNVRGLPWDIYVNMCGPTVFRRGPCQGGSAVCLLEPATEILPAQAYSLGQVANFSWAPLPSEYGSNRGATVQYSAGSRDGGGVPLAARVYVVCGTAESTVRYLRSEALFGDDDASLVPRLRIYSFELYTRQVCSPGLDPGTWFIVALAGIAFLYFGVFGLVNYACYERHESGFPRGLLPHRAFWANAVSLVADGMVFCYDFGAEICGIAEDDFVDDDGDFDPYRDGAVAPRDPLLAGDDSTDWSHASESGTYGSTSSTSRHRRRKKRHGDDSQRRDEESVLGGADGDEATDGSSSVASSDVTAGGSVDTLTPRRGGKKKKRRVELADDEVVAGGGGQRTDDDDDDASVSRTLALGGDADETEPEMLAAGESSSGSNKESLRAEKKKEKKEKKSEKSEKKEKKKEKKADASEKKEKKAKKKDDDVAVDLGLDLGLDDDSDDDDLFAAVSSKSKEKKKSSSSGGKEKVLPLPPAPPPDQPAPQPPTSPRPTSAKDYYTMPKNSGGGGGLLDSDESDSDWM